MQVAVGTPLEHRRWLRDDVERKARGPIVARDRLDEWASREFAISDRADASAFDSSADRIRDAHPKQRFGGRRQLTESHYRRPHALGRSIDLDGRNHFTPRHA